MLTPDEIRTAFDNLEITRERLEEGTPLLMVDRIATQEALSILQASFDDGRARVEPQPDAAKAPGDEGHTGEFDKEAIEKLAKLSPFDYDRAREAEGARLGCVYRP